MNRLNWTMTFLLAILLCISGSPVWAQYDIDQQQEQENVTPDTTVAPRPTLQTEAPQPTGPSPEVVLGQANAWLRRVLFRGTLDATHIGAYAQYQVTPWREDIGSYGAVLARLTVYYLGSTEWLGRDAEWLQAVYRTMDEEPTTIEYDIIVSSSSKIEEVKRLLYRIDHGEIHSESIAVPQGQLDYDVMDQPVSMGDEEVELYSGKFQSEKLRGSGFNGATVVLYRVQSLPPLGIVVLGYGEQGLTYTGGGSDATPRMNVPPPPSH